KQPYKEEYTPQQDQRHRYVGIAEPIPVGQLVAERFRKQERGNGDKAEAPVQRAEDMPQLRLRFLKKSRPARAVFHLLADMIKQRADGGGVLNGKIRRHLAHGGDQMLFRSRQFAYPVLE